MTQAVCVQRVVAVEPQVAFRRFVGEIGRWWVRRKTPWGSAGEPLALDPEALTVSEGGCQVGRIVTWRDGEAVAFTLHGSRVHIRFERHPNGTLLTLEQTGWEAFAGPLDPQSTFDLVSVFWLDGLGRL